jgi:FMN phosphatase YigB (HAD superfamily)
VNAPEGFLFDLGDTLVGDTVVDSGAGNAALLDAAVDRNGVTVEMARDRVRDLRKDLDVRARDSWLEPSAQCLNRLVFDPLGVRFDRTDEEIELIFWEAAIPPLPPTPGVERLLDALARRRVPVGVLSNWPASVAVLRRTLVRAGLDPDRFDVLVTSGHYGIRKPHPEIFRTTVARLGTDPARTWFAGNRLDVDVAGARSAGLPALWYAPGGEEPTDGPRPDLVVRHWDEVTARIEEDS